MIILLILYLSAIVREARTYSNSSYNDRHQLYKYLMESYSDDSQTVLPSTNMSVNISIVIYNVFGISENEVLESNGVIKVMWKDPKLTWSPSNWSGVSEVKIAGDKVWKPDIGISNAKQYECKDFTDRERMYVEAKSTGDVSYFGYFMSDTPCPIVTRLFPFDEQACPIIFSTYYSTLHDFHISIVNVSFKNESKSYVGQWRHLYFVAYEDLIGYSYGDEKHYQEWHVLIVLGRKPMYHVVLIIMPYALISSLASIIFLIEDVGMRLGVSLTILLAKSVYIMIVSQGAPKSMIILSVLDNFLIIQMGLLVALSFIVVLGPVVFTSRQSEEYEESHLTNLIIRSVGHRIRRMKSFNWNRSCDVMWLVTYLVVSLINGIVCLFIIPKMTPSLAEGENWRSLLPAKYRMVSN